jgi:hypothetical protein
MVYQKTIQRVHNDLLDTFQQLDTFFELPADVRQYRPAPEAWSMNEILEHITLTNHFLMITLKQSLTKVLRRAQSQPLPEGESQLDRIVQISDPDAFSWIRPEHMEPTRQVSSLAVRQRLVAQSEECLNILRQISNGEGALHQVRMSVQQLGKLDLYEWLYFLIQHTRRHVVEMQRIREQYHDHPHHHGINPG